MKKVTTNPSVPENKNNTLSALDYYNRACKREAIRDYEHAIKDLDKAIIIDPDNIDFLFKRGKLKLKYLNSYAALLDFEKVIKINPDHNEAHYHLNFIYSKIYHNTEVMEYLNDTLEINPEYRDELEKRGLLKLKSNDYIGAIDDFDKAIIINPWIWDVYTGLSEAKRLNKNVKESKEAIIEGHKVSEYSIDNLYKYTVFYFEEQKYEDVIRFCSLILKLDPNRFDTYYLRGVSNFELEKYFEAIEDLSSMINFNPASVLSYLKRGSAKIKLKDRYGAFADFRKALALDVEYFDLYFEKVNSEIKPEEFAEEMKFFLQHIVINN